MPVDRGSARGGKNAVGSDGHQAMTRNDERRSMTLRRSSIGWNRTLRREAPECTAHITFTKALERAIAELSNALARHAEHRANLLERVLTSAFEPEVETEHLCVTWWQRAERLLDLIVEEAIHCFLL